MTTKAQTWEELRAPRRSERRIPLADQVLIREAHSNGVSVIDLAYRYRVWPAAIYYILKKKPSTITSVDDHILRAPRRMPVHLIEMRAEMEARDRRRDAVRQAELPPLEQAAG